MAEIISENDNIVKTREYVNVCKAVPTTSAISKCPRITQVMSNYNPTSVVDSSKYIEIKERYKTDKRVFLNIHPTVSNPSIFSDRVMYVLGEQKKQLTNGTVYGFLYSCLNRTAGLVFPYTPRISFSHQVNYDRTDIIHSNISINHYKNTPPPSIHIDAVFTADTKEMAKHMLSAIWFLRAVTKSDFGEQANNSGTAGVPPPILYLNGWDNMIDNLPVVIKSFSYTLPDDKDYVGLGLNLNSLSQEYIRDMYSDSNTGLYYNNISNNDYESLKNITNNGITYINGQPMINSGINQTNSLTSLNTGTNYNNAFFLQEWLPTELSISIELEIQYNVLKYKKVFNLNDYKMGILYLDNQKQGNSVYSIDKNGNCNRLVEIEYEKVPYGATTNVIPAEKEVTVQYPRENNTLQKTELIKETKTLSYGIGQSVPTYDKYALKEISRKEYSTLYGYQLGENKSYKFDNSGWTW